LREWNWRSSAHDALRVADITVPRFLIVVGLVIAGIGVLMSLGVPFGRLPGDLVVRRGAFTFYVPIVTSIVLSLVLTLLFALLRR
jgi:hypothetical protein